MSAFFKKFIYVFFSKKIFFRPAKKKILLFYKVTEDIFYNKLNNKNYGILAIRREEINVWVLFKIILKFRLSLESYVHQYINYVQPNLIVTSIDNSILFYKLKKFFPNIKFVSIQNGYRFKTEKFINVIKDRKYKNQLEADYIFLFNSSIAKIYSKYIKSKKIIIGSFRNNNIPITNKNKIKKSILFISTFKQETHLKTSSSYRAVNEVYAKCKKYSIEIKLLPLIINFCKKNNIKFFLAGQACSNDEINKEKLYYNKILNFKKYSYIKKKNVYSNYKLLDQFNLITFTQSTLGYEAAARGNKIASFSARRNNNNKLIYNFGWPSIRQNKSFYYTDTISKNEVDRILGNTFFIKDLEWKKRFKSEIKKIMDFDKNNKTFFNIIKKYY